MTEKIIVSEKNSWFSVAKSVELRSDQPKKIIGLGPFMRGEFSIGNYHLSGNIVSILDHSSLDFSISYDRLGAQLKRDTDIRNLVCHQKNIFTGHEVNLTLIQDSPKPSLK